MKAKSTRPRSNPAKSHKASSQRYAALKKERDLLRKELRDLKTQRDQYLKALYALTRETVHFDENTILAEMGKRQSLQELIAELESFGN